MISNSFPGADSTGSQQRTNNFFKALSQISIVDCLVVHERAFYYVLGNERIEFTFEANEKSVAKRVRYLPPGLKRIVSDLLLFHQKNSKVDAISRQLDEILSQQAYDFVVCRYFQNYRTTGLYQHAKSKKVILDIDDVPWKVISSQHALGNEGGGGRGALLRALSRISTQLIRLYCSLFLRSPVKLVVSNPNDRSDWILNEADHIPNIPKEYEMVDSGVGYRSKRILFVANLQFDPNIQGLHHFALNIWPRVLSHEPEAVLEVVGRYDQENESINQIKGIKGISVLGYVDDLVGVYESAQFTVAPIFFGGGTKIKVLESLSFRRTVVTTVHSIGGYENHLKNGQVVLIGKNDEEIADHCIGLLKSPALCERMGKKGREITTQLYGLNNFCTALSKTIQGLEST